MFKNFKKKFKNEKGLTLVELLAVIVILAIIAVIAFVLIGNVIDNAKKDAHIANAQQMIASAKLYEANGNEIGEAGVTEGNLMKADLLDKFINPWTKKSYDDGVEKNEQAKAKVTKSNDGTYSVVIDADDKCPDLKSAKTEEELLAEDARDALCP